MKANLKRGANISLKSREIYSLQILPLVKFMRRDRLESFAEREGYLLEILSKLNFDKFILPLYSHHIFLIYL